MSETDYVNSMIRNRLVHEIHTSERRAFRSNRLTWKWMYHEFYYPKVSAKPLEFGVAFHNAMETLYNPETWAMDRQIILNNAMQVFKQTCEGQLKNFLENKEQLTLDSVAEEDYAERIDLGIGMLKHFGSRIMPEWDAKWKPRKVEVEFIVPIQNPDTDEYLYCKCERCVKTQVTYWQENEVIADFEDWSGLPVGLAGRIDAIMENNDGGLWIVDWKTAAQLHIDFDTFLQVDDQINSYVMALRRKLDIDIKGFLYVEIRKAYPEPPKENASLRLGRKYSVSKSQATTPEIYRETVSEGDPQAYEDGLYDDFLTFLEEEGSPFAHRYQLRKSNQELEQIERMLFLEASEMIDPDLKIYPSFGRFNFTFSPFQAPLQEFMQQGDYQFMLDTMFEKRTRHYWVKEPSTDDKVQE